MEAIPVGTCFPADWQERRVSNPDFLTPRSRRAGHPLRTESRRAKRCSWLGVAGVAFAVLFLARLDSAGCRAADDVADLPAARRAIDLRAELDATDASLIAAARQALEGGFGPLQTLQSLDEKEQTHLAEVLRQQLESATVRLKSEAEAHDKFFANEIEPSWKNLAAERERVAAARDQYEREERKSQQTALALGTEHRWFWLAALLAVTALLAVFALERRHEVRRYFNGGLAKGMALGRILVAAFVLLAILTAMLFFASDGILVDWLDRSTAGSARAKLADQNATDERTLADLASRQAAQGQELGEIRDRVEAAFGDLLPAKGTRPLLESWLAYWQAAAKRQTQHNALKGYDARLAEDLAAVGADESAIAEARSAAERWRLRAHRLCGLLGVGVVSLVGGGAFVLMRSIQRRTTTLANTCPLCLNEGSLKEAGEGTGSRLPAGMVRCEAVISESPFEECNFDFPSLFRSVPKVCFPTLGIPSAGKTHWLAMVYRQLNLGNFPKEVEFAKIRSSSSDDFERIVDDILVSKTRPGATQTAAIPKPVVFNFLDHDKLGRSNILVNIFDYSGEVLRSMTLEDHQRKRAFTADGYFFFLDPTKTSDEQTQPLANFRQDVRTVKGIKAGQQIRCPVALCISKIDLMPNADFAQGGNIVDNFYRDLGAIGWGMDVPSIRSRSELMRQLRNDIWPNWEIERQVDDLFGGRYMFFPLTPVGLNEPGVSDLNQRVIAPVGILHPLMWLLHMNGYPVLGSDK